MSPASAVKIGHSRRRDPRDLAVIAFLLGLVTVGFTVLVIGMFLSLELGNERIVARRDLGTMNSFSLVLFGLIDAVLMSYVGLMVYMVRRQLDEERHGGPPSSSEDAGEP